MLTRRGPCQADRRNRGVDPSGAARRAGQRVEERMLAPHSAANAALSGNWDRNRVPERSGRKVLEALPLAVRIGYSLAARWQGLPRQRAEGLGGGLRCARRWASDRPNRHSGASGGDRPAARGSGTGRVDSFGSVIRDRITERALFSRRGAPAALARGQSARRGRRAPVQRDPFAVAEQAVLGSGAGTVNRRGSGQRLPDEVWSGSPTGPRGPRRTPMSTMDGEPSLQMRRVEKKGQRERGEPGRAKLPTGRRADRGFAAR